MIPTSSTPRHHDHQAGIPHDYSCQHNYTIDHKQSLFFILLLLVWVLNSSCYTCWWCCRWYSRVEVPATLHWRLILRPFKCINWSKRMRDQGGSLVTYWFASCPSRSQTSSLCGHLIIKTQSHAPPTITDAAHSTITKNEFQVTISWTTDGCCFQPTICWDEKCDYSMEGCVNKLLHRWTDH